MRPLVLSKRIARLRLTIFLVAAAGLVWMIAGAGATLVPLALCAALFAVFGGLVVWHARVDARVAWFDALRLVNLRAMSRRARDWHALPEAPAPPTVDLAYYPYAVDLIFSGHASLFQWLGPAATPRGRTTLAERSLRPGVPLRDCRTPGRDVRACGGRRLAAPTRSPWCPGRRGATGGDRSFPRCGRKARTPSAGMRASCAWPCLPSSQHSGY